MRDLDVLKATIKELLSDPNIVAHNGATYCNLAAMRAARAFGCDELDNSMADDQYNTMMVNASKRWARVSGMTAAAHSGVGGLAFAAKFSASMNEAHGHIALLSPLPMQMSGSLGKMVPVVCNIGKENGEMRVSKCFPVAYSEPDYFIYD